MTYPVRSPALVAAALVTFASSAVPAHAAASVPAAPIEESSVASPPPAPAEAPPQPSIAPAPAGDVRVAADDVTAPNDDALAPTDEAPAPTRDAPVATDEPTPPAIGDAPSDKPAPGTDEPPPDAQAAPTPAAKSSVEITGEPGKGLTVRVSDAFSLNIRSRFLLRYQLDAATPADGRRDLRQLVGIGTARLWFSGHVFEPRLTYMIQLAVAGRDFRDGAVSPIFDAYLDWAIHRDFNVRAGQFFVPFDRLRTVREFALQMGDRPRPVGELTLDRDVGVVAYSERFLHDRSPVAWRVGAFGGGGTNLSVGKDPGGLFVGRLELRPLGPIDDDSEGDLERRKRPAIAIGGAFAANLSTNRLRSTTGATFAGGTTHYLHGATDVVFKWRGLAIQGEYLRKVASVNRIVSTDADGNPLEEYTRTGEGWVAQASYVFDPPIELVARLAGLYSLGSTDPTFIAEVDARGQEVGGGVNYYFNGHRLKLQADWIALMPHDFDFGRAAHVAHLQLDVTF